MVRASGRQCRRVATGLGSIPTSFDTVENVKAPFRLFCTNSLGKRYSFGPVKNNTVWNTRYRIMLNGGSIYSNLFNVSDCDGRMLFWSRNDLFRNGLLFIRVPNPAPDWILILAKLLLSTVCMLSTTN
jgi:hypothetical protein